jgi:hypothetical protein
MDRRVEDVSVVGRVVIKRKLLGADQKCPGARRLNVEECGVP